MELGGPLTDGCQIQVFLQVIETGQCDSIAIEVVEEVHEEKHGLRSVNHRSKSDLGKELTMIQRSSFFTNAISRGSVFS